MPTVFDQVQACDGRDLIQKLTYFLVTEIAEKKVILCQELERIFQEFGIDNFSPCTVITDNFVESLLEERSSEAVNLLFATLPIPPYGFKVLSDGLNSLSEEEQQQLRKYLIGIGINTAIDQLEPVIRQEMRKIVKCPTEERTLLLLNRLENFTKIVNKLQSIINRISKIVNVLSGIVNAINISITAAQTTIAGLDATLPLQAATPTGASGLTARIIARVQRLADKYSDEVADLDDKVCKAAKAVQFANNQITILQGFLQVADALLRTCIIEAPSFASRITPQSTPRNRQALSYRGYTLEVRTVQGNTVAPQRYAVALDTLGVVVLEGPRSYSSNTDILIEELKFRIDNQLG
jgi:hypothetical protein